MSGSFRPIVRSDEESYLSCFWDKTKMGLPFWRRVGLEFRALISMKGVDAAAYVDEKGRTIGFVVTAFLRPGFETMLRKCDEPDIVPKLVLGESVIDDDGELGHVNASGILVGSVISFGMVSGLSDEEVCKVDLALMNHAIERFSGYNLFEMMIEAHTEKVIGELRACGFVEANDYAEWWETHTPRRATRPLLMTVNGFQAQQAKDYNTLRMFFTDKPKFGFTEQERTILQAALRGLTDEEVADVVGLGRDRVRQIWNSMYAKSITAWVGADEAKKSDGRGGERRRKLLKYVGEHPEEIRPYGLMEPRKRK